MSSIGGRYQIVEIIADGMMGPVYRGINLENGTPVLIKTLEPEKIASEPSLLNRYFREDEALRRLIHPNIVLRLDAFQDDEIYYLVTEFISGGTLRERLDIEHQFPLQRVFEIGISLADGLAYAHEQGVLHRDIKPENILLDLDGTPKISDFGIAHLIDRTTITKAGDIMGTWVYISPEAFRGETLDERADIWAFGIMLFEMLAGQLPFTVETPAQVVNSVLMENIPDIFTFRPDIPSDFRDLIELMLSKDKRSRIASARLLKKYLMAIKKGEAINLPVPKKISLSGLPELPTSFVGRKKQLSEITNQILKADCHLLTLVGPGGVGKTRLALRAAQELRHYYPHGIYFVDLAPILDIDLVIGRIARVVGVKEGATRTLLEDIVDFLWEKRILLILDNFEQIIGAASIVGDLVSALPKLDVIVTSRERLQVYGEYVYSVPGLSLTLKGDENIDLFESEAVLLFEQRAQAVQPGFKISDQNKNIVEAICAILDGLPLAIELAAARIRIFPPKMLLKRLKISLDPLIYGPRDRTPRHQTLRGAIDWSYQLLDEEEKKLCIFLAIFRGGWTLDAAQAVCGDNDNIDVISGVESIEKKSLLQQKVDWDGVSRFFFLEMIQRFMLEKLDKLDQKKKLLLQHALYFVDFVEKAEPELRGPQQEYWSLRVRTEYDNLRLALEWTLEGGDPSTGVRLAGSLAEFWYYEGPFSDGKFWISKALNFLDIVPKNIQAKILNSAGMIAFVQGDHKTGEKYNQGAMTIAQEIGEKSIWAWALFWLSAHSTTEPEKYENGILLCKQALQLFEEIRDEPGLAWGYNQIGELSRITEDYEQAQTAYEKSIAICRKSGNRRREAIALINLGYVLLHQGDAGASKAHIVEGLKLLQELKLKYHSAIALAMLAGPLVVEGNPERAAIMLGASDGIFARMSLELQPADQVEINHFIAIVREQLDDETFEKAWQQGSKMTFEQAIYFTLSEREVLN